MIDKRFKGLKLGFSRQMTNKYFVFNFLTCQGNTKYIKLVWDFYLIAEWLSQENKHAGEGVEKGKPLFTVGKNENCYGRYGKPKMELPYWEWPSYTTASWLIHSKNSVSYRDTCSSMFIAVLVIIARKWNQPTRLSTQEWIIKMWYIYRMICKGKWSMKCAETWVALENTTWD